MNPYEVLTVYNCPFTKTRIGRANDGGYVTVDLPDTQYSIIISGGICDDISFEQDFISRYPTVSCFAIDGTVHGLPGQITNTTFIQCNIGDGSNGTTTLKNIIDLVPDNIFVKMDIEGGEIPWLECLDSMEYINKFAQIVMEFHDPFSLREHAVFQKLNQTHVLVHLHGNNNVPLTHLSSGIIMPRVFECTYIHKKYVSNIVLEKNTSRLPGPHDMPNMPYAPDINLNFPPFYFG